MYGVVIIIAFIYYHIKGKKEYDGPVVSVQPSRRSSNVLTRLCRNTSEKTSNDERGESVCNNDDSTCTNVYTSHVEHDHTLSYR